VQLQWHTSITWGERDPRALVLSNHCVGMVPTMSPFPGSIPYTRSVEHKSRPAVQVNGRQTRLAAKSGNFSEDKLPLGPTTGRPVCIEDNQANRTIFQLETRPSSRSSGCFQAELGTIQRVCQPSLGSGGTMLATGSSTKGHNCPSNSIVANTKLVPSSVPSSVGQPKVGFQIF